jgi:hypothetical protein
MTVQATTTEPTFEDLARGVADAVKAAVGP